MITPVTLTILTMGVYSTILNKEFPVPTHSTEYELVMKLENQMERCEKIADEINEKSRGEQKAFCTGGFTQ